MRYIGLLIVVAIIYMVISHQAATQSSADVKQAIATVDANLPAPLAAPVVGSADQPAPARTDYKRAIDRAHSVVGQVQRQQNEQIQDAKF
jgi:hypothetical protein